MEPQNAKYKDNLELYLNQVDQLFDISRIINEPQGKTQIVNYYVKNSLPYRLGYSWDGFFHCGISYDGKHKRDDFNEQARMVESYVRDRNAKNVLELGYGSGANSAYLAKRNPCVVFEGIDLSLKPLKRFTKMPNVSFHFGDYHDLSNVEGSAYDIIFAIESLCCSTNKLLVFQEVKKKLARGGRFIVIDAYHCDRATPLSPSENIMWKLIEKSTAIEKFECVKDVENYMRQEYSIDAVKDLSPFVLPSLERQESKARHYFFHPVFAKCVNKFIPFDIIKNVVAIFLLPISIRRQIGCYYAHVLKNSR